MHWCPDETAIVMKLLSMAWLVVPTLITVGRALVMRGSKRK